MSRLGITYKPIRFLEGLPLGAGTIPAIRYHSYTNSYITQASPQACGDQGVREIQQQNRIVIMD